MFFSLFFSDGFDDGWTLWCFRLVFLQHFVDNSLDVYLELFGWFLLWMLLLTVLSLLIWRLSMGYFKWNFMPGPFFFSRSIFFFEHFNLSISKIALVMNWMILKRLLHFFLWRWSLSSVMIGLNHFRAATLTSFSCLLRLVLNLVAVNLCQRHMFKSNHLFLDEWRMFILVWLNGILNFLDGSLQIFNVLLEEGLGFKEDLRVHFLLLFKSSFSQLLANFYYSLSLLEVSLEMVRNLFDDLVSDWPFVVVHFIGTIGFLNFVRLMNNLRVGSSISFKFLMPLTSEIFSMFNNLLGCLSIFFAVRVITELLLFLFVLMSLFNGLFE